MGSIQTIQPLIYDIRGYKVMLDNDLAALYEISTSRLNQAVKRNSSRFPPDFMFQLTTNEWERLISQFVIAKNQGGRRIAPYAFTEHGILMLSSVLNSAIAVEINIKIMRVFVEMRRYAEIQTEADGRIQELRELLRLYMETNDKRVNDIIAVINNLIAHPPKAKPIGFNTGS